MAKKNKDQTTTPRIGKLNNLAGVLAEMGAVYREARRGDIDKGDAARLVWMLGQMRAAMEASDLERRLDAALDALATGGNRR